MILLDLEWMKLIHRILAYWVFHFLGWFGCWRAYSLLLDSPRRSQGMVVFGMGLMAACLGTQVLPFLWPGQQQAMQGDRQAQHLLGLVLAGAIGLWGLLGMIRIGSKSKSQKALALCVTEQDELVSEDVRERFLRARMRLRQWQDVIGRDDGPKVPLVLSESVAWPTLFGLAPPRILVPFELVDRGVDLCEGLEALSRRAKRRSYRACMGLWWLAQFDLVLLPMGGLLWRALAMAWCQEAPFTRVGMKACCGWSPPVGEQDRLDAGVALHPMPAIPLMKKGVEFGRLLMLMAPVTILLFGCLWGIHGSGGLNIHDFWEFVMNKEIIGFSAHGFDPTVEFRAIPGEGGILPDGLLVDTTKADAKTGVATVRVPLGLFDHEKWIPFGAKAVRVRLSWRVLEKGPNATELPAVKLASSEQGVIDADGQQKLWTYYARNVFLGEQGAMAGTMDLPILVHSEARVLPESKDVIYGPLLFIPEGWRIEFRHYWVDQIEPAEVPPMPAGEGERFVAWYHRNGFKPATIDLQWREAPQGTN